MSSYSELIKNFEKIRTYMREFYVYGFKSREEYNKKSARSYDDERRRMESWLGDHMSFVRTPEGKNVFISIDSRVSTHNPFYKALKAKSFTDGDITLHFVLFDILHSPEVVLSLPEILEKIDEYLDGFETPMVFDESTVRKKLKEYISQGIIVGVKDGRKMLYHRAAFEIPLSIENIMPLFFGALFVIVGNYMPKCKQNYSIGIKLPWTLNDEENWNRTHRLAGKLWVAGGFLEMMTAFFGGFILFFIISIAMIIIPTVYSYVLYKKTCDDL